MFVMSLKRQLWISRPVPSGLWAVRGVLICLAVAFGPGGPEARPPRRQQARSRHQGRSGLVGAQQPLAASTSAIGQAR